jgi:hypothetical protein
MVIAWIMMTGQRRKILLAAGFVRGTPTVPLNLYGK